MSWLARTIATAGGAGYSPVAPGTVGTAVAVPLAWLTAGLPWWQLAGVLVVVLGVGVWAAGVADRGWGTHDSGRIVIDEVAGYLITVAPLDRTDGRVLLAGFVAFRLFDIVKPPPVGWIDRHVGGGWGVVLDDVAAGLQAALVLLAMSWFLPGWLR